ncbi:MAG: hypothetical protein HN948_05515, partial [Clostridia bacterium]|nr:hypothetical protein [Clostridia bacterium]
MIYKKIAIIIVSISLLLTCACAGDVLIEEDTAVEEIPQYTLPPVIKDPVPKIGGELVFPMPKNPATINPLKVHNVELTNLLTLVYEQLVHIDIDGKATAELAETWEADATGTIWTFKLRRGVQWQQDYGQFTAHDVIYTIDQIMNLSPEESRFAVYNHLIVSYIATDNYTIAITLSEPSNAAIYFMTFPVLCQSFAETTDIETHLPVGTGPYLVTEYDKREQMQLIASDVWWKQPPYIQKLTALCYSDHDTELVALDSNLLDFVTTSTLAIDTYIKYNQTESLDYLTQYYDCLIPNVTDGVFSDVSVRQAIAFALDKRDLISKALLGHAVATDYPIPLDSFLSSGSTNIHEYNLQKAIELLDTAGWKNRDDDPVFEAVINTLLYDLTIDLLIYENSEDTYRRDVADNIKAQLINVGIEVNIIEVPYSEYLIRLANKDFDLALCSFYLDQNPDPTFMIGTGGSANYGGFTDLNMDLLLQNCKTATNDEDMVAAYITLEDYFVAQAPHIGLYFRTNSLIFDSAIT